MILEMIVAAVMGFSFGNAWACILLGFGASAEHRVTGKYFIAGRFLGLLILGSAISLLRFAAQDIIPAVLLIFGVSTILFGILMLLKPVFSRHFFEDHQNLDPKKQPFLSLLSFFMVIPLKKGHRGSGKHGRGKGECTKKRMQRSKKFGFSLGFIRGATPCAKVIILTPLLVSFGFPNALILVLVYATASTIYPVIGYLFADVFSKFEAHKNKLRIAGALTLVFMGIYFILKVTVYNSVHIGM